MTDVPNVEIGWFEKLKNTFNIDAISQKLNLSKQTLLEAALFLGAGFVCGFLWKRYANYFIAFLIFIALLIILQQLDLLFIKVNWSKLQECCGIQPSVADSDMLTTFWSWVKMNVFAVFSFFIGFCLGVKVS
jgi:uncharacterized membrane protein (Fun14 family)